MPKYSLFFLLVFLPDLFFAREDTSSVDQRPRPELAVGLGYGRGYAIIDAMKSSWGLGGSTPKMFEVYSSPVLTLDYHMPLKKFFCLGVAFSYQQIRIAYRENEIIVDFNDVYQRINVGLRPMFYFPTSRHFSVYTGLRLACTFWDYTTDHTSPAYYKQMVISPLPSGQIFLGFRYAIGNIGIGLEGAAGTAPYLGQANIFYRF